MLKVIFVVIVQVLPDIPFPCFCARKCSHFSAHPSVGSQYIGESWFVLNHTFVCSSFPFPAVWHVSLLWLTFNSVWNTLFVCSNIPPSFLAVWIFITDENARTSPLNLEIDVYSFRVCLECWDARNVSVLVFVSSLRCKKIFLFVPAQSLFHQPSASSVRAQQGCSGVLGLHVAFALGEGLCCWVWPQGQREHGALLPSKDGVASSAWWWEEGRWWCSTKTTTMSREPDSVSLN